MKAQKLLTLDSEIVERLKGEGNASQLINNLLQDYFFNNLETEEEIIKKISELTKEIIEREELKETLGIKLKRVREEKEAEKGVKAKCLNCRSTKLLEKDDKIICISCGWESKTKEWKN